MEPQLFAEFNPVSAEDWKKRLEKDLKGITFRDLSVTDRNGITVHPFYTREDQPLAPLPLSGKPGWHISTRIAVQDAASANTLALEALNNGVSGLYFVLQESIDPAVLLQEIQLPYIHTCFIFTARRSLASVPAFAAYIHSSRTEGQPFSTYFCWDPVGQYLAGAQWQENQAADHQAWLSFVKAAAGIPALSADATLFHHAGANTAYELACCLSQVNEYLHVLDENNLLATQQDLHISLATDTSFFEQIAKLRALRSLLPLLYQPYGINPELHLHTVTSDLFRAPFDRYSNLLRDTLAGMAAVAGSADSLYTRPFDATGDTAFSRRMSRNQQLIFKEESYLDKVADVAAGSYYLETLTAQIAAAAWTLFQQMEQEGGLIAAFDKGIVREQINTQAAQLVADYKSGKRVWTGINKFPNPADPPQAVPETTATGNGLSPLNLSQQLLHD